MLWTSIYKALIYGLLCVFCGPGFSKIQFEIQFENSNFQKFGNWVYKSEEVLRKSLYFCSVKSNCFLSSQFFAHLFEVYFFSMSEISRNNADEVEEGRPRRAPRRVPFVTLRRGPTPQASSTPSRMRPADETDVFEEPPTARPHLNDLEFRTLIEMELAEMQPHDLLWHQTLEAWILTFPPVISAERNEAATTSSKPKHNYVFLLPKDIPHGWECGICLCEEQKDVVLHPCFCHSFHRECLSKWLDEKPSCPICRRCVTPLLMVPAAS
jgi:hypothetical protein